MARAASIDFLKPNISLAVLACAGYLAAIGSPLGAASADAPASHRCDTRNVVVYATEDTDVPIACEGARDAIEFLASQGLDVTGDIAIGMVSQLPSHVGTTAIGCYLETERRVLVRNYSAFEKCETWFGIPVSRRLYRSLVAHEVAHAVAACNFRMPKPTIQANEYIAYVTMFATMEPGLRERVMSQSPGEGYEGDWQMTATIYLLDPTRFGVQAYRHFLKPGNGRDYLRAILTGRTLADPD